MSHFGSAKTYSRKPDPRATAFDNLLADKKNKPSTAKVSVAGVHRWGMTSYTSIRKKHVNGEKESNRESTKKPKLEKTVPITYSEVHETYDLDNEVPSPKVSEVICPVEIDSINTHKSDSKLSKSRQNKFFKSGSSRLLSRSVEKQNKDFDALRMSVSSKCSAGDDAGFTNNCSNELKTSTKGSTYNPSVHYLTSPSKLKTDSANSSSSFDSLVSGVQHNKYSSYGNSVEASFQNQNHDSESEDSDEETINLSNRDIYSDNMKTRFPSPERSKKALNFVEDFESGLERDFGKDFASEFEEGFLKDFALESKAEDSLRDFEESFSWDSKKDICTPESFETPDSNTEPEKSAVISSQSSQDSVQNDASKQSCKPKKIFSSSLKYKAVYNHRHWHSSKKEETSEPQQSSLAAEFEEEEFMDKSFNDAVVTETQNTSSGDIISYKCPKESKPYYTVVKNVKQAYQCHESGETQEFNDDIEYLLECVQKSNVIGTRCLSVLNLASKCMSPAFRIHLRAHGTMPKIFSALFDAPSDANLALCTATLMFVLSQDRLTMDIEASTLSLMLQLLETDPELLNPEKEYDLILKDPALCAMQDKHREKVFLLCEEMQQKGHAKHLKLDNINTGILATETLLSLTSRKAGEWFKEEMRTLRGLDRIVDTVESSTDLLIPEQSEISYSPNDTQLDKLRKIDRCLRVLENVSHMNTENQEYLMRYNNSGLVATSLKLINLCKSHFLEQKSVYSEASNEDGNQKPGKVDSPILSCLLNVLKILSNVTHGVALDDSQFPAGEGLMDQVLVCILQVPRSVPSEKHFDLLVLSLGFLINLVEYCPENSVKFINLCVVGSFDTVNDGYEMVAAEALIELMMSRLESARLSEEQADDLLNSQEEKQAIAIQKKDIETAVDDLEETLMKTLQKAGKHMEHSIIAAYIAILLGCVGLKNSEFVDVLKDYVPDGKFDVMVEVLKKFKSFVTLTGSIGNTELSSIQRVIQFLESS